MSKAGLAQAARTLKHVLSAPVSTTGWRSPEEDAPPVREAGDDHDPPNPAIRPLPPGANLKDLEP